MSDTAEPFDEQVRQFSLVQNVVLLSAPMLNSFARLYPMSLRAGATISGFSSQIWGVTPRLISLTPEVVQSHFCSKLILITI